MRVLYRCSRCGYITEASSWIWKCPKCGGPLDLVIDGLRLTLNERRDLWRFSSVIPARPLASLGEGFTPLIKADFLGSNTYLKLEYLNPTGSFKDRGSAVAVSKALEFGVRTVIEDSSGNAGISIAAYAAAAGIKARIYVPKDAPEGKKSLIKSLGAELIEAPSRAEASKMAVESVGPNEAYIGHAWNPWFIQGTKILAYELLDQLGHIPSAIVFPASAGTLLLGLWVGFNELISLNIVNKIPRLYAIQAQGFASLYERMHGGNSGEPTKLADALRVSNPPRLEQMVSAIRDSKGDVLVVTDDELLQSWKSLLRRGIIVEPSSAIALSGYIKLLNTSYLSKDEDVVIILTGSGLKYIDIMSKI
ncbi:pyridoxal-phosphate dependent enzyme [Vulcanisaeta sp. JCM 16159]|uniref:threonine synthase n=1 Tax=Vulcanisaeta sp. JCM 16159 TaxID=1295371 RepID=UPI0006D0057A|nr:pyridoxal-phosphate dependent enzyme [Vulcanisaeta sp. JCM 16159]